MNTKIILSKTLPLNIKLKIISLAFFLTLSACAENKSVANYDDNFLKWDSATEQAIVACNKENNCIKNSIKNSINQIPEVSGVSKLSELVRDTRVGLSFIKSASNIFYDDFGIDEKSFTGAGVSVPTPSYNDVPRGVSEFWSPNVTEKESTLWTWKIPSSSPEISEKTVGEVISNIQPVSDNTDKRNFSECFNVPKSNDDCNFKRFLHDEKLPILFRCAEFDESKYTKAVGRKGAKRVFFTRLSDVFDISVKSACSQTDRKVKNGENKQTIFVWIFMPTTQEQVVPATWGNLFKHFAEWENIK